MRLYLSKTQKPVAIVTTLYMLFFTWLYVSRENYEFLIHILILLFFASIILYSNYKVRYPVTLLWALTVWGFLHMSGGALYEIFEFIATRLVVEHGVGGYVNNSMDLIFNFLGALTVVILIKFNIFKKIK